MSGGRKFEDRVAATCRDVGFVDVRQQVVLGRRRWGPVRHVDVVARCNGLVVGIECRYQGSAGSAEEKCVAALWDMEAWPVPYHGLLCIDGEGWSSHMRVFLEAHPRVIVFEALPDRLNILRDGVLA